MGKEFIPYEQALALKELGFDEPCFKGYTEEYKTLINFSNNHTNTSVKNRLSTKPFTVPLYQQAFRWFREKYNLYQFVHYHSRPEYTFAVYNDIEMNWTLHENVSFNTYEEAELACLKKLIEIVKRNNNE